MGSSKPRTLRSTPPISVLVSTRNRPDSLRVALDSILRQSYRDFELIVVDQSTDEASKAVTESFADPRITYIRTDTIGLGRSRNVAVRASHAEILAFTDDDCVCDERWLASILDEYRRDPTLMAVYGRVLPFGPPQEGKMCVVTNESMERRVYDHPVPPVLLGGHNNCSFRKDLFRQLGLYIDSLGAGTWMGGGEDAELLHRALLNHMRIAYAPAPLVYHNKWVDQAGYTRLMIGVMLVYGALLVKFALMLDSFACVHFVRLLYYIVTDKLQIKARWRPLAMFAVGSVIGLKYRFVSPPRLLEPASPENDAAAFSEPEATTAA